MLPPNPSHTQLYDALIARFRGEAKPRRAAHSEMRTLWIVGQQKLLRMPEAFILSGEWHVLAKDRVLLDLAVDQPSPPDSAYIEGIGGPVARVFLEVPFQPAVDQASAILRDAFLLGGSTNYAHWMLDVLPRLSLLKQADAMLGKPTRLLVNPSRTRFQDETLTMAGVDASRLHELDYPGVYPARDCFIPCTGSGSGTGEIRLQSHVLTWLRQTLMPKAGIAPFAPPIPPKRGKRLFISREGDGPERMRLMNHGEVIDALAPLGFEVVHLAGMSVADQIRLFAQATFVTGPHGAGFTNMAFAPKGATLIELMGPMVARDYGPEQFFARLCSQVGQRYERVIGEPVDPEKTHPRHVSTERYKIAPTEVVARISALLR